MDANSRNDDREVIVEMLSTVNSDAISTADEQTQAARAEGERTATFERDGQIVSQTDDGSGQDVAQRYVAELSEDVSVVGKGPDTAARLTAAGEALELVLGDKQSAETFFRKAIRTDSECQEAHESLRRIHRGFGNWRTVAQLLEQEIAGTKDDQRRAQLLLGHELLVRTRPEAAAGAGRSLAASKTDDLPPVYQRMLTLLQASHALSQHRVEQALELRASLSSVEIALGGEDGEAAVANASSPGELTAYQEWTWSEANLRRSLLGETQRAKTLLLSVFDSGRRDRELLDALTELLVETKDWDQLRLVFESATESQTATASDLDGFAGLLERRFRDAGAAAEVLKQATTLFPEDPTLARRQVEVLSSLSDTGALIDSLGNLLEVTEADDDRVELLWRLGTLFEESSGLTSAATEVFHEAVAVDPHHGATLRALGRIYIDQQNWIGLADLYEKELAAPDPLPDAWRRHFQLAEIYDDKLKNRVAALRHYRFVLNVRPAFRPALDAMVRLYSDEGDWEELVRLVLDTASRVGGKRRQVSLLEQAGRVAEDKLDHDILLREILTSLLDVDPTSAFGSAALGRLLRRGREWEALIAHHLREAGLIEDTEETATLFWQCARIAERGLKDTRRAEQYYRKALDTAGDFLPALEGLGRILLNESRFEDLIEISEREIDVLRDDRLKPRRLEAIAELYDLHLGRRASAIETYERILETNPGDPTALRRLFALYSEQGRWEQVVELMARLADDADASVAAERFYRLGELRERKTGDDSGSFEAYAECLHRDPDHVHALRGALRIGRVAERELGRLMEGLATDCQDPDVRRVALRHLARHAERRTGDPTAGLEYRKMAVTANPRDREARDMLEAAYAHTRNLPGLAGVWSAAGRTVDEGLLGLMAAGAGINAASLLNAFLERWGDDLEGLCEVDGRDQVWHAALGELSRTGLAQLAAPDRLAEGSWSGVPGSVRRRIALDLLSLEAGTDSARAFLDQAPQSEPGVLRLRAMLATRDSVTRIAATRAEVQHLATPELRVRRLLELVELEPSAAPEHFRKAVSQEAFDSPIQEQLYESLSEHGEYEVLREALEAHLCVEGLSVRRRSHLAYMLGQTIEQASGTDYDALCAYRTSFQSGHQRHDALLEMARLTEKLGDHWDAIRCLEAFLTLSGELEQRVEAGLHLGTLYLGEAPSPEQQQQGYDPYAGPIHYDGGAFGNKALELLSRLREEARGTELEVRCVSALARAHTQVGSPYFAVELFQDVIMGSDPGLALNDSLALVDLYCHPLGDYASAAQLLFQLQEAAPANEDVRRRLLTVARYRGELAQVCQVLEGSARNASPDALTPGQRRDLLILVAEIYTEELGYFQQAAQIWLELARGATGEADTHQYRSREAAALCRVAGQEARCHELLLELNAEDPMQLAPYEGLGILYDEMQDHARSRTVAQILALLDPSSGQERAFHDGRRKVRPSRAFDEELLRHHLVPEGLGGGVLEVLQALEPLAVKTWGDQTPTVEALGGKRWRGGEFEEVMGFVTDAAEAFNLQKVRLFLSDAGPSTPQVFGSSSNVALWFHRGMFEGAGAEVARFVGGYAVGLAWSGISKLTNMDGRDLWHLLDAVLVKQTGVGLTEVTDPRTMELAERVGGAFNRSVRKRIVDAALPCLDLLRSAHCEAWPAMIEELATRSGLVLSGQIAGAMQAILRGRQWKGHIQDADTLAHMAKLPEVSALLRFAISEEYLALRHGCGLGARARVVG